VNVYEINNDGRHAVWIAAKDANSALSEYLENEGDNFTVEDMAEGETVETTISIKRQTTKQIEEKFLLCCPDGSCCAYCEDANTPFSFQDFIDRKERWQFPCVIASEE